MLIVWMLVTAFLLMMLVQGAHERLEKKSPRLAGLLTLIIIGAGILCIILGAAGFFDRGNKTSRNSDAQRRASAILNDVPYDVREAIKDELRDEINEPEPEKWQ